MAESTTISMRIDWQLKADAETIFQQLGMTTTEGIKIFLAAVRNCKGLPFQVQIASEVPSHIDLRKNALDTIVGVYPMISSSAEFSSRKQEEIECEERKFNP